MIRQSYTLSAPSKLSAACPASSHLITNLTLPCCSLYSTLVLILLIKLQISCLNLAIFSPHTQPIPRSISLYTASSSVLSFTPLGKMTSPIDLTEDPVEHIPSNIVRDWLPAANEAVRHLFTFNYFPHNTTHYFKPPDLASVLHEHSILGFDPAILPQLGLPINPSISKLYQDAIKSAKHPIYSVTLALHPTLKESVTLPVWVFDYWREIEVALSYQRKWEAALTWLRPHLESPVVAGQCRDLMMSLSFFPWSGNNISVENITAIFSSSPPRCYLNSFHIDYMVEQMSRQHQELYGLGVSGRHVFATTNIFKTIIDFYGTRRTPVKTGNHLWERLAEIENRIVQGEVDSVCGAHYLPLHWVSVVFDIKQWCIIYGDSLNHHIPGVEHTAFTRWIQRLSQRSGRKLDIDSILVHPLQTGYQNDSTSCGLFALNAIGCHYLDHQILPADQMSLVSARMDIALDLLNGNMVCPVHYTPSHTELSVHCRLLKLMMTASWLISPFSLPQPLSNQLKTLLWKSPHQNPPPMLLPSLSWMTILSIMHSRTPLLRTILSSQANQEVP